MFCQTKPESRGSVVVTGGTGGLGQVLVRHLADQGFRVFAATRAEGPGTPFPGVTLVRLDVTDDRSVAAAGLIAEEVGAGAFRDSSTTPA